MCHLNELDLSENKLQGELMGHFELYGCTAYDLEVLNLSDNDISDRMPTWLGQLENLRTSDLSNNYFNGPIPKSFVQLVNLRYLDISSNKLDGIMFVEKGWPLNLIYLNLSHNQLSGSLPKNIGHIFKE
jgi:Leucine-rich repeat (LRR) protein